MIKAENDKAIKCGNSRACAKGFINRAGFSVVSGIACDGRLVNRGFFFSPKGLLWQWTAEFEKGFKCGRATDLCFGKVARFHEINTRADFENLVNDIDSSVKE